MYIQGPDNSLLNLTNAGSAKARGSWQVGQLLKALVLNVDSKGSPTLEINGRQVTAQSQAGLPLRAGQMLQLEVVQDGDTPLLKVLNPPSNPQETMSRGVRESLPQQQPLNEVLNNLQRLAESTKGDVGQQLRALSRQLFEQLPRLQQLQSGPGVKQAVEDSGNFLEAKLQNLLKNSGNAENQPQLARDLKAGLLRLLQVVRNLQQGTGASGPRPTGASTPNPAASQTPTASPNPAAPTASGNAAATQGTTPTPQAQTPTPLPQGAAPQTTGAQGGTTLPGQNPATGQGQSAGQNPAATAQSAQTNAPTQDPNAAGARAALAQTAHTASLAQDSVQMASARAGGDSGQNLESGLARIQFNQLHSLQQTDNQHKPSWLIDIPIRHSEGRVDTLQMEIQRDREADGEEKRAIWTVSLSFELNELGAIRAGLTLVGEKQVGVSLWADRADTTALFQQHTEQLREGMKEAGLYVSRVGVQQGLPKKPPPQQPFSDNNLVDVQA